MTVLPPEAQTFIAWLTGYGDVGDPATAAERLRVLTEVRTQLGVSIGDLELEIVPLGKGVHDLPSGPVTIRVGAERYEYPKARSDEALAFYQAVVAAKPDGKALKDFLWELYDLGPRACRTTGLHGLTPLRIYDYRRSIGKKTSVAPA